MNQFPDSGSSRLDRRSFLASGALAAGATLFTIPGAQAQIGGRPPRGAAPPAGGQRAETAYHLRHAAALAQRELTASDPPVRNGDEQRYTDYRASFHKTLPQNEWGEVDASAFLQLVQGLESGSMEALEAVPLSSLAERGLANPLAARAFEMAGPDAWALRISAPPEFEGVQQAAEMTEVYWHALTRDVSFREYGEDPDILAAAGDLDRFRGAFGPGPVTSSSVFRGRTEGDRTGPYLSQFLWLPARWGLANLEQRFSLPLAGEDFCVTHDDWLAVQRGISPLLETRLDSTARYMANGRDLAEYVHDDVVYQAYLTAALVMLGMGDDALDPSIPYFHSSNQVGFVTFGVADIADLVARVAHSALKAAWYQKWQVHRRLRPEVFAARAHFQMIGERYYGVHDELLESDAAARLLSLDGNLFLPLAYPEGSPTHPSYPAGHAAVAGACATVLKAFFNEQHEILDPVQASADGLTLDPWTGLPLTLGGEINKLASNISLGRDFAGVHYRSDGIEGMDLGEQVALGILADYARTRVEDFPGFTLTRFDGDTLLVGAGGARAAPANRRRGAGRPRENG